MIENNTQPIPLFVFTSWLKQAKLLDNCSSIFTILALVLLFMPNQTLIIGLAIILFMMGIVEKYFAFRVSFDNELFKQLMHHEHSSLPEVMKVMDEGLVQLKLIKSEQHKQRSLASRQQGALSLFKKQCYLCIVQLALFIVLFFTYIL